jgi:hypothetical protein
LCTIINSATTPLVADQRPDFVALPERFSDGEAADAAAGSYDEDGEWFFCHGLVPVRAPAGSGCEFGGPVAVVVGVDRHARGNNLIDTVQDRWAPSGVGRADGVLFVVVASAADIMWPGTGR